MDISLFDLGGEGISNESVAKEIQDKLFEKYEKNFIVKRIGNRYGVGDEEIVTTFCSPEMDDELVFTASLNKNNELVDDYNIRFIMGKLEREFKKEFKENSTDVFVRVASIGKYEIGATFELQEYIDSFSNASFLAYIVLNEEISNEILTKIYEKIRDKYKNIYLKSLVYVIEKEDYERETLEWKTMPTITSSDVEECLIKKECAIKIFENNVVIID